MSGTGSDNAFSFVRMEREIPRFWDEAKVFQRSLKSGRDRQPYIFYDGPPFATGLPHHGNLLASVIKDIVPRYWTIPTHSLLTATRLLFGMALVSQSGEGGISTLSNHLYL